jgi:hypothetical protein
MKNDGIEMPEKFTIQIRPKTIHNNVPPNLIRADFKVYTFTKIELEIDRGQPREKSKNDLLAEIRLEIRSEEGKSIQMHTTYSKS